MRYFDDKAVDPPKRRTRGTRGKGRVIKVSDDRQDTTTDIHGPVHALVHNRLCDLCRHGGDSHRHSRGDGSSGHEGARE